MILRGAEVAAPFRRRSRVLVVGSGAGGALVAARLAERGVEVLLVEAGPYVGARDFTQLEREMMPLLYHEAGLRQSEDGGITVLHGRAVGGSTVVNYLDCFRTPDRLLHDWVRSRGLPELAPEKMRPRWERIEAVLHVRKMAEHMLNPNNRKLKLGADRLGWKGDVFHRNALDCYGSGFCDLGCAYNAKQSAAITWVPLALAAGATLLCDCRVDRVRFEGSRAVGVEGRLLGPGGVGRGEARIDADLVVVAGGAVETPYLLLRSGAPDESGQLGRNLHLHPATAVVGVFPEERIAFYEGIKQGYYVSEFSWVLEEHPADVLIEGVGAPPGLSSAIFSGWGESRRRELAAAYNHLSAVGVLVRDHQPGSVAVGPGRPAVHYQLGIADAMRLKEGMRRSAEAWFAAGATEVATPHAPALRIRHPAQALEFFERGCGPGQIALFTFHQMGTARMGARRDRDVVDPSGRLWGSPNLYVADSSLFPNASGVNPQLTVYGLADVVADGILAALGA